MELVARGPAFAEVQMLVRAYCLSEFQRTEHRQAGGRDSAGRGRGQEVLGEKERLETGQQSAVYREP